MFCVAGQVEGLIIVLSQTKKRGFQWLGHMEGKIRLFL